MKINIIDLPAELPEEFFTLPWKMHPERNDWIPPIIARQKYLFSADNDFFQHGEAVALIAYKKGLPVGRLVAFVDNNSPYISFGHFGFFEVIDNVDITKALFEQPEKWLLTKNKSNIVGPIDFNIYEGHRLQIEGHRTSPFLFEPRNPVYYQEHLAALGMKVDKVWSSKKYDSTSWPVSENQTTTKYNSEVISSSEMRDHLHSIFKIITRSNSKLPYHSRISFSEFKHAFLPIIELNDLDQLIVFDGDRPVACCIVSVDYTEALQRMDGTLSRTHHLDESDKRAIAVKSIGILPSSIDSKIDAIIWEHLKSSLKLTDTETVFIISENSNGAERSYATFSRAISQK